MFYKTQIQSVTNGGAVDVNGRSLRFIGYLPVKAGDIVFTDGNVIFGNAPPKGAPAVSDMPSGIPVLADYDSSGANELRGYFTDRGKYKPNKIKGDMWLVNDKKTYKHDTDDSNIIDAEIAADGSLYTVEKIDTQSGTDNDDVYTYSVDGKTACTFSLGVFSRSGARDYYTIPLTISFAEAHYARFNDIRKDSALIIRKGDNKVTTLKLSSLCKSVEGEVRAGVNFLDIPSLTHEDHIKSRAILHNFKILPDGNWEALIWCEVWAERRFEFTSQNAGSGGRRVLNSICTRTVLEVEGDVFINHYIKFEYRSTLTITQLPDIYERIRDATSMAHSLCLFKITPEAREKLYEFL